MNFSQFSFLGHFCLCFLLRSQLFVNEIFPWMPSLKYAFSSVECVLDKRVFFSQFHSLYLHLFEDSVHKNVIFFYWKSSIIFLPLKRIWLLRDCWKHHFIEKNWQKITWSAEIYFYYTWWYQISFWVCLCIRKSS